MRKLATIFTLTASLAYCTHWLWSHHVFMWGGPILPYWMLGVWNNIVHPTIVIGAILFAAWAAGRSLIKDWLVAVVLGLGMLAALTWGLALAGMLYTWSCGIVVVILMVSGIGRVYSGPLVYEKCTAPNCTNGKGRAVLVPHPGGPKHGLPTMRDPELDCHVCNGTGRIPVKASTIIKRILDWPLRDKLLLGALVWWVLRTVLLSFNPSIGFDAIHAHLWQTRNFLVEGGYVYHVFHTNFAVAHSLTMLQQALGHADPGSTLQYVCALITAGFLYRIGSWLSTRTTGLLAALLFLIQPWAYLIYSQWFAGMVMLMFTAAAVWMYCARYIKIIWPSGLGTAFLFPDRCVQHNYHIIGLLLGLALATKISCAPLLVLLIPLAGRRWWKVAFWCAIAATPWLLVNLVQYGNPFYPFRQEWFAWWPWATHAADAAMYSRPTLPNNWMPWQGWLNNFWYNNSPIAQPGEMSIAGPFCAALTLPLLLVWRKMTKPVLALAGIVLLLYLYWWGVEGIFHARYMSYVLMLHTLLGAWGITMLFFEEDDY